MRNGQGPRGFAATSLTRPLWPHQRRALEAFERDLQRGHSATYLVLPPGGGKTLVGLEAARRLNRPTVVLCPNTAIQAQWLAAWRDDFAPATVPATADRALPTPLTVLTYQSVCVLGNGNGDAENDDNADNADNADNNEAGDRTAWPRARSAVSAPREGPSAGAPEALLSLLHPNGRALAARLRTGGPWTLVLDECHHLLEVWGRLLQAIINGMDRPHVIGLTATPPRLMTTGQAELHAALFGRVDLEVSAPALVRDGRLAPYQELAYFTRPTPPEADHIHDEAVRFAELRVDLLDPTFASTPLLAWLDARLVKRYAADGSQVSWQRFEHDEPALADAAVRLHTADLLPLPDGARVREQHRGPLTADDWVVLISDYALRCLLPSDDPRDATAYDALRRALPSVGYRLTRTGARACEAPVDRVLARSASKADAAVDILRAELGALGTRLRALVLCDVEQAGGVVAGRLADGGRSTSGATPGGAVAALRTLLADAAVTVAVDPVLVTGRRVACGPDTARRLLAWLRAQDPDSGFESAGAPGWPGLVEITATSGWHPRRYVPLVTRFFTQGGSRCLIGTRALLGEGWDAPAVNVVIDLTVATTPTAVVQTRGRALRLDRGWPEKVANNWSVACLTDEHPKGSADYDRLVRKHDGYFALGPGSDIIAGVAHVDERLSEFAAPPPADLDRLNATALRRAELRDAARERWAVGSRYADEPVATVVVDTRRPIGLAGRATTGLAGSAGRARGITLSVIVSVLVLFGLAGPSVVTAAVAAAALAVGAYQISRTARRLVSVPSQGALEDLATATADALLAAGATSRGGESVRIEVLPDGGYRARLADVPPAESTVFCTALDEVVAPLAQPRYIIGRLVVPVPRGPVAAVLLAARRLTFGLPGSVIYHAVPTVLGANRQRALLFRQAWNARVSPGDIHYTGSPEGAGILAVQRGADPFAVTTRMRTLWR